MVKLMEKVASSTLMEIFIKESGKTIKPMVSVFTDILMVQSTEATGSKINSMEKELKPGLTSLNMRVTLLMEQSMAQESSLGLMVQVTKVNLSSIILVGMVNIDGVTRDAIKVLGKIIRCTAVENSRGPMAANTWVTIMRTKKKVKGHLSGQMGGFIKDLGKTASSTAEASSKIEKVTLKWVSGMKASVSGGMMKMVIVFIQKTSKIQETRLLLGIKNEILD